MNKPCMVRCDTWPSEIQTTFPKSHIYEVYDLSFWHNSTYHSLCHAGSSHSKGIEERWVRASSLGLHFKHVSGCHPCSQTCRDRKKCCNQCLAWHTFRHMKQVMSPRRLLFSICEVRVRAEVPQSWLQCAPSTPGSQEPSS